ncbi:MAG: hypothetical protein ABW139_12145 [Candidatus Thiodiazotropha sp. DIVDIV]
MSYITQLVWITFSEIRIAKSAAGIGLGLDLNWRSKEHNASADCYWSQYRAWCSSGYQLSLNRSFTGYQCIILTSTTLLLGG